MKRVLYMCADPGIPFWGTKGASIHLREFTRALIAAGHEPTVATVRLGRQKSGVAAALPVVPLPQNESPFFSPGGDADPVDVTLSSEARQFAGYDAVCRRLQELHGVHAFDIVCERYSLFNVAGCDMARRWGVPYVLEVNAPLVREAQNHRRLILAPLAEAVERYVFSHADRVVAVSRPLADYIRRVAPESRVTIVPNGVDLERFTGNGSDFGSDWETKRPEGFCIGFVGTLKPWHGVENLIDAFARLRARRPGGHLLIVGDGPNRSALEESVAQKGLAGDVCFTGPLPHDRIPAALAAMDAVTAPYPDLTDFYFSPLKVYEYMAAGKAIVASHIGQMVDILEDRRTALLPPAGDVGALTDALDELQMDRELRDSIAKHARAVAHTVHGWNHRMQEWDGLFETLCRDSKPEGMTT